MATTTKQDLKVADELPEIDTRIRLRLIGQEVYKAGIVSLRYEIERKI